MSLEWHSRGQGFDSPWLHQFNHWLYKLMRSLRDAFAERGGSIADKPAMIISVQIVLRSTALQRSVNKAMLNAV
jgi:hypothetical protein